VEHRRYDASAAADNGRSPAAALPPRSVTTPARRRRTCSARRRRSWTLPQALLDRGPLLPENVLDEGQQQSLLATGFSELSGGDLHGLAKLTEPSSQPSWRAS